MPSYFYHLNFELYPYPSAHFPKSHYSHQDTDIEAASPHANTEGASPHANTEAVYLPPPNSDIFHTQTWPNHTRVEAKQRKEPKLERSEYEYLTGKKADSSSDNTTGNEVKGGAVIDCGLSRAVEAIELAEGEAVPIPPRSTREAGSGIGKGSIGSAGTEKRGLETAAKDWRFGRVRLESVDMERRGASSSVAPATSTTGSGSVVADGILANLAEGAVGRVTKARCEEVKGTDLGWGVVHLYRDGEETPELDWERDAMPGAGAGAGASLAGEAEDCTTLCIPAVPSYLSPNDFLGFVGEKTREQVSHFRMVMTGRMNRYMVLMKFRDGEDAKRWKTQWDGTVFNSVEPEACHVLFIKSITFRTPTSTQTTSFPELSHDPFTPPLKPFPPPTPSLVELPTCPVCLERMDDTTGLLTILCQHVFHCACLQKWRGSGCPVCRATNPSLALQSTTPPPYDASPPFGAGDANLCSVCDSTTDLWICLICGSVGCGRYKGGHAKDHWKETAHNFALEIETQHVWDYAEDTWVHRLIREKGDSKVIELPSSRSRQEEDMVPREKLERIGMEYTHLLTSQLESQRVYFEELVGKAVAKASAASASASLAASRAAEAVSQLRDLQLAHSKLTLEVIPGLEKDVVREKKKSEKASEMARGFGKSLREEKGVNEGLMERIEHVNTSMAAISAEMGKLKMENEELKEENRDLLFSITAGEKLQSMKGEGLEEGELEGGMLGVGEKKKRRGRK